MDRGGRGGRGGRGMDRGGRGGRGGRGNYRSREPQHEPEPPTMDPEEPPMRFADEPFSDPVKAAVEAMGFTEATPIQTGAIPPLMNGRDVIGQAQTGTGKTAAFGIPLIEAASTGRRGLVLAPTRELAKQVQQELQAIGKGSPVEAICIVGGAPFRDQLRALERHPNAIIVATPGRIVDHLGRGTIDLSDVSLFVLDEADEMLSMGFQDELDAIIETLPQERQNVLFSATMAPAVERLARKTLNDPVTVRAAHGPAPTIRQCHVQVAGRDRVDAISRILEAEDPTSVLVFARTRARVDDLVDQLRPMGADALHGGMSQPVREGVMRRFRDQTTRILVATDVAARGLDVETIDLVLHDELPTDVDTYIHRIGRTGRAGREGTSIILVTPGKLRRMAPFERVAGNIARYTVPDDEAIAAARATRLVDEVRAIQPSDAAREAMATLLSSGLTAQEVGERVLESMLGRQPETAAPEPNSGETTGLALKVGHMDQIHPGSLVGLLTNAGGLPASAVGRIDILEKMSVVEVPRADIERVCEALARARLSGRPLLPREADDWSFRTTPRH